MRIKIDLLFVFLLVCACESHIEEDKPRVICFFNWVNDTKYDCIMTWNTGTVTNNTRKAYIHSNETYSLSGWYDQKTPYLAKEFSFYFINICRYSVDNSSYWSDSHLTGNYESSWWNTLPNSEFFFISGNPLREKRVFYLSDVLEVINNEGVN